MGKRRTHARRVAAAYAAFNASTVVLSASLLPEAATAGFVIGTLSISGPYLGGVTYTLDNDQGGRLALDATGKKLIAGLTPVDFDVTPTLAPVLKVSANLGDAFFYVTLSITVQQAVTPVDYIVKPTAQTFVDLAATLAPVSALDDISLAVSGTVSALVWPETTVTTGQTKTFCKRELSEMLAAVTVGAPIDNNAGAWTLTWTGGSAVIAFATALIPTLTHKMGGNTFARHGGYDLSQLGGGTWTITGQSTAGAFEVFYQRLVWRSTNGTATTYGATKAIPTPTRGAAAYTVDVTNGTLSYTISMDVDDCYDGAPLPSGVTTGSILQAFLATTRRAGDTLRLEDGNYTNSLSAVLQLNSRLPRLDGYALPTHDAWDQLDRWITVTSKNYLGAKISAFQHQAQRIDAFDRFTNIDMGAAGGAGIAFTAPGTGGSNRKYQAWVMVDHCRCRGGVAFDAVGTGSFQRHHIFLMHNHISGGGANVYSMDSKIRGNLIDSTSQIGDSIRHGLYNSTYGSDYSELCFNFIKNRGRYSPEHPDFSQLRYDSGNAYGIDQNPRAVQGPIMVGNVFTRANPPLNSSGQVTEDGQGLFGNDIGAATSVLFKIAGHVQQSIMINGIYLNAAAAGSVIRNLTALYAFGVSSATGSNGNPRITLKGGSAVKIEDSVSNGPQYTLDAGGAATPTVANNIANINEATAVLYFNDPYIGRGSNPDLMTVIAGFTPKHADLTGAVRVIGAITSRVDIRRQTYDPTILVA